jgi:hypothetical protein
MAIVVSTVHCIFLVGSIAFDVNSIGSTCLDYSIIRFGPKVDTLFASDSYISSFSPTNAWHFANDK